LRIEKPSAKISGAVAGDPEPLDGQVPLLGTSGRVRFAAVALVVPLHALLWSCALWQVTGQIRDAFTKSAMQKILNKGFQHHLSQSKYRSSYVVTRKSCQR